MTPVLSAVGTRMSLRVSAAARRSAGTASASLVTALVVGILGMHALASHGSPTAPTAPTAASSTWSSAGMPSSRDAATATGDSLAGHAHAAAATAVPTEGAVTGVDVGTGSGHGMTDMVMSCIVMLAAAALTLLVRLFGDPFRPLLPAAFEPAVVHERVLLWVRGTGPPPVWAFSVIRC